MSGDDVRISSARLAASDALCRKSAEMAKYSSHTNDAMTVVLRVPMQTGQI